MDLRIMPMMHYTFGLVTNTSEVLKYWSLVNISVEIKGYIWQICMKGSQATGL